jgi:hypothetical protein
MAASPLRSLAVLSAISATATLGAGCGASGKLAGQEYPAAAEQLVSRADLGRFDPTSPTYVLMDWWRDAQFSDLSGYLGYLTRSTRVTLDRADLERQLPILAGGIRTAKPRILTVEIVGNRATVYTKVVFRQPIGAIRYITTTRPQAFHLVRIGNVWRMADTYFADSITAAAMQAAQRATSR